MSVLPLPSPAILNPDDIWPWRADAWQNTATALGTARDKSTHVRLRLTRLGPDDGETFWRADGVASAIVEKVVTDSLRGGHELELCPVGKPGQKERGLAQHLEGRLHELDTARAQDGERSAIHALLCQARAIGGSTIIPYFDDFSPLSEPLVAAQLLGKKIRRLNVLDCRELSPLRWRVGGEGGVELWQVNERTESYGEPYLTIHGSRLIRAHGDVTVKVPRSVPMFPGWPGDTCFVRVIEHLARWAEGNAAAGALISDFSQMTYVIKGLADTRGKADMFEKLMKRLQMIELSRGVVRGVVLDENERAERVTTNLAGLPDTLDRIALPIASASQYPVEVIFGRQAAGLNATGEAALQVYDQRCEGYQISDCQPVHVAMYKHLLLEAGKDPAQWVIKVKYAPLRKPTRLEDMQARLVRSQIDQIEIDAQVVSQADVTASRHGGDEYGWETIVSAEPDYGEMPGPDAEPDESVDVDVSDLAGPVDAGALQALFTDYNDGKITRPQALTIMRLSFGMDATAAELALGPPPPPVAPATPPPASPPPVLPSGP